MRIVFVIISLFLSTLYGIAQEQYVFRLIDVIDGLSDNQIRGITMTPDCRIAVRTGSILNIYNGATFEHFPHDKKRQYSWNYSRVPKEYYDSEGRIWMKERDYLLLLDLNTNQFNYEIQEELLSFDIEKKLINLFIDDSKNYWFLTEDNTFSFYDINKKEKIIIEDGNSEFTKQYGVPIELVEYKNLCWIVYNSGLIRCWDYASHEFTFQETRFLGAITSLTDRLYIHPDSTGNIWLMYNNGLHFYDRIEREWTEVDTIGGLSNFFTCMDIDQEGNIWVGTSRSGLRYINHKTFEVTTLPGMKLSKGGVLVNDIYSVFVDKDNGLWIGTLFNGLCYYHPSMQKFQLEQTIYSETYITNENVRCFLEDEDGSILVGSGNGLFRFYPETKKLEKIFADKINDLCLTIYRDSKNRLWVGTYLNGFFCIDNGKIRNYIRSSENLEKDPGQNISRAIYEDEQGRFWVIVTGGVGQFNPETGNILSMLKERHPEVSKHELDFYLYPIDDEYIGVVGESGIYYYYPQKDSVWTPPNDTLANPKFQDFNVKYFCLWKDSRNLEWFGTEDGIRIWDDIHGKLYKITVKDGLSNDAVSSILEDENGSMWVSTINGICKIDVQKHQESYSFSIVKFGISDGLQSGKFYDHSALKTKDGTLYFGGMHGFNYFNPTEIVYNMSNNKPIFVNFSLFNNPVREGIDYNGNIVLEKPINKTESIVLRHNENFITIEFSGLNYVNPSQTYYKYKLENFDEDWNEILSNGLGKVTYTGLRPGKYKFIVYTANNDKVWGDTPAEMIITIKSPFWLTTYAMLFYGIVIIGFIFYWINRQNKKNKRKLQKQQEVNEQKQKEELEQIKFRFFTNISHEFRTPLTLILTPLETLIKQQTDLSLKKKLESIYQNASNLLKLVNQLLDFRKLEMSGEKIKLEKGNIVQFTENIYIQFKELAVSKGIEFNFETKTDYIYMFFDHDKMYKILNNLLSNAFKFTPEYGIISLEIDIVDENNEQYVKIQVNDTGCGIDEKELNLIFNRFYQTTNENNTQIGSGIGLHLVKEYSKLHNGKVVVNSKLKEGSQFIIFIPTNLGDTNKDNISNNQEDVSNDISIKEEKKTLLIVEDNNEFRHFLIEQLSPDFNILEAAEGESAEQLALSQYPDLILSDLMMPKVNGLELCQRLKSNIQTSHIPFILLTARNSDDSKIDGYEAGADSYISKPFSFEMLLTRINKLIEQQENRKTLFRKTIEITPSSITTTSLDEELVQKALIHVEENIDNPEYSIEDLGKGIGLSKSHLNRKLRSITGLTPLEFIRSIRLKRAAQLLINTQYNINEIADLVGFNTLKYFNRHFKDEFKMTPTQYRESYKQ